MEWSKIYISLNLEKKILYLFILNTQGDSEGARKSLIRAAHAQPWLTGLWRVLSVYLLQNSPAEAGIAASLCKKSATNTLDQVLVWQYNAGYLTPPPLCPTEELGTDLINLF